MERPQILIVEDEPMVAELLEERLKMLGYDVAASVRTGEEAVEKVGELAPDLVLMDVVLAGEMDGVEAAAAIHERHDLPVVFVTGYADDETLRRAQLTEPLGYLLKPFENRELHAALTVSLTRHRMERRLKEREQWLAATLNCIASGVIATDSSQRITFMNKIAENLTGWGRDQAQGRDVVEVLDISAEDAPSPGPATETLQDATMINQIAILRSKAGRRTPIEFNLAPIRDERRGITGAVLIFQDIARRKQVDEKLRKLSSAVEQTADLVVITDKDGAIEYANPAFKGFTGYSDDELLGRTPRIVKSGLHDDKLHRELWETILGGGIFRDVFKNRKKNGEIFLEEKTIGPLRNKYGTITHFVSTGKDITKSKQLEDRLEAIYQLGGKLTPLRHRTAVVRRVLEMATQVLRFESAYYGLVDEASNEMDYYQLLSEGEERREGYRRLPLDGDRVLGISVVTSGRAIHVPDTSLDLRPSGLPEDARSILCVPMKAGERIIGMLKIGSAEPYRFTREDQQLLQALADQASIALENVRLQETEREQFRRLQESQAQLIQAEKLGALGRLVASIAHEINNPLQSIEAFLTLIGDGLKNGEPAASLMHDLEIVESEFGRISTAVKRLQKFYRPARQEQQWVDLHPVLDGVLELCGEQLQQAEIAIARDFAPDLPAIRANDDHLRQVFVNLTLNAIAAMKGGGILHLRTGPDEIASDGAEPATPAVRVEIRDTGTGIPRENLNRIFEPFFTTRDDGSGLGLFVCYGIIESHSGRISVSSRDGEGTTFSILLPAPAT
ncbi:MAG: PAS domain S-box protein [bacterium]|nr:PAS domain S-box protein [bacterium]